MRRKVLVVVGVLVAVGVWAVSRAEAYTCSQQGSQCQCTAGSGYCSDCNTAGCIEPESGVSCCAGGAGSGGHDPRHPTP